MSVGNPEAFKIQLTTGRPEVDNRKPCDLSNLTLKKLCEWIDRQNVSLIVKEELKKSASRFPHQALKAWRKGYSKHLALVQRKLRNKNVKKSFDDTDIEFDDKDIDVSPDVFSVSPNVVSVSPNVAKPRGKGVFRNDFDKIACALDRLDHVPDSECKPTIAAQEVQEVQDAQEDTADAQDAQEDAAEAQDFFRKDTQEDAQDDLYIETLSHISSGGQDAQEDAQDAQEDAQDAQDAQYDSKKGI